MAHTSAPWQFRQKKNTFEVFKPTNGHGMVLARDIADRGDAELIAAAPELLSALRGMIAFFGTDVEDVHPDDLKMKAWDEALAVVEKFKPKQKAA